MTFLRLFYFCCAWLCASGLARADDAVLANSQDVGFTHEKSTQHFVINNDGSYLVTIENTVKINETRAIATQALRSIGYNKTLESVEIIQAYTEKPDGRKIAVGVEQIKDQQEARSLAAPMFQDTLVKTVIFPDVAVGDRLVMSYRREAKVPLFPGYFSDVTYGRSPQPQQFRITYDAPVGMALLADAKGFTLTESPAAPGRKIYRWDYTGGLRDRAERSSVAYADYGNKLVVSNFPGYVDLGKAYQSRAQEKSAATPKIRALAARVTGALVDPKAKTLALADWVRKNIRYVAVFIGPGGVVPHSAESVIDNRYGDCKDHVALLEALLSAVGIDSTGALVNAGAAYAVSPVASLGIFNHILTYVPSLNLYIDSTAAALAPGDLERSTVDKPVLLTKSGALLRTPARVDLGAQASLHYVVSAGGDATFEYRQTIAGHDAEVNRFVLRQLGQSGRALFVERLLQQRGLKGSGTFDVGALDGTERNYSYGLKGRIDNLLALPGSVTLPAASSLLPGIAQTVANWTSEKRRTQNYTCPESDQREEISFDLPDDVAVIAMPKDVAIDLPSPALTFTSSYSQRGQTIVIKRSLRFSHERATCVPGEFEALSPALLQINKDLRGQIIVQSKS